MHGDKRCELINANYKIMLAQTISKLCSDQTIIIILYEYMQVQVLCMLYICIP